MSSREKEIIEAACVFARELFLGNAGGHDLDHTFRVWHNASAIAESEPGCCRFAVELAALLHDADDYKLFQTENNANARAFMVRQGLPAEQADRICEVINSVSFSKNREKKPETLEGKIVQDADRLDAIGAIGIARTFAFGGEKGRLMTDSLNHFHEKLLLLRDEMNTDFAKAEADKRHAVLERFLAELDRETDWAKDMKEHS